MYLKIYLSSYISLDTLKVYLDVLCKSFGIKEHLP